MLSVSRNIIGRNPSMVIPLLANQDLTPMLIATSFSRFIKGDVLASECSSWLASIHSYCVWVSKGSPL